MSNFLGIVFFCCVIMSFIIGLSEDFESVILNFELELLN